MSRPPCSFLPKRRDSALPHKGQHLSARGSSPKLQRSPRRGADTPYSLSALQAGSNQQRSVGVALSERSQAGEGHILCDSIY